jgi:circadian clock protein KaiC
LYVTLAETGDELRAVGASHGWSMDQIQILDLVPLMGAGDDQEQTLLHPSEVELGETVRTIMGEVAALAPARLVIDSLSELRLLGQGAVRYRRQILALKRFFSMRDCTVRVLDDKTMNAADLQLHSIAHGVIALEQTIAGFGAERRRLHVVKMRGMRYRGGYHDFEIERGGLRVFPRLVAAEHVMPYDDAPVSTGSSEFDSLLGGGLTPGTATLFTGPAGVGKTTAAVQCVFTALQRGETVIYLLFDERLPTLLKRSASLGMDLRPFLERGSLRRTAIDPAQLSPGELAAAVRSAVETDAARMVVIDSLNAYLKSMPNEQYLVLQMHELLTYLGQRGIVTLLVLGMHGLMNDVRTDVDLSYLADTAVQLRYFEAAGSVRQAISVIKTRTTRHERTIREFEISETGLRFGEPLRTFRGVLAGEPAFSGSDQALLTPHPGPV